jgi:hypothetical protein
VRVVYERLEIIDNNNDEMREREGDEKGLKG